MAHLTECRVLLARALLAEASYDGAIAQATLAARQFQAARRLPWAAQARYVALQAEALVSEDQQVAPPDLLRRSRRIAVELEQQGWPVEALHVRTFVGRLALALGRPAMARAELAQAADARTRGTADLRAQAWHATALLRVADGDVTVYTPGPDKKAMFELPRWVVKGGELVVEQGEVRQELFGRTLHVEPAFARRASR